MTQPGVRRYLFDNQLLPPEATTDILQKNTALFAERGFGLWLARPRDSEQLIGFSGFWFFHDPPDLQLIYAVGDDDVGRGYGREMARAIVEHGFTALKMDRVRACTDPPNIASQRLLDDLGFMFEKRDVVGGLDTLFYLARTPTPQARVLG